MITSKNVLQLAHGSKTCHYTHIINMCCRRHGPHVHRSFICNINDTPHTLIRGFSMQNKESQPLKFLPHFLGRGWRTGGTRTSFQAPHHSTISPPPWRLQSVEEQSVSTIAVSAEGREHLDCLQLMKHSNYTFLLQKASRKMTMYTVCMYLQNVQRDDCGEGDEEEAEE